MVSRSCEALRSPACLALRHQHQRAVDRHHLVEEDRDVHRARLRHAVVALPGAVILVPLPDVAGEGGFGVDLELVHVEFFAEDLLDRLDHARMRAEQAERLVVEMRGKGGARRAALLAPHLGPVGVVDADRLAREIGHFLGAEQLGQEQPAFAVEIVDLLLREFHVFSPFAFVSPLMVRSASSRVSNHEAAWPILRDTASPLLRMRIPYAALLVAFSLSSVIRPAVCACASAAASAFPALPARICTAIASCSLQALSR